ncbi:Arf-GAP domain and FG repeat-containing protein 1 [Choanephora cucurbitarum]|uniref:Arf-GAP domain and FG repeat-containing protein 1 n=1 Tax=Choanephora cucurbitarum TaxID=101091 RepID=A0A1C7NL35_9FUNG|nr:Arf-GAP domain and FG repeat-containing protein 1 [Choanephora cucurbitarum]
MAAILAKKQEEWNAQKLQELLRRPENKKCFDCPTKSPFFVNVSIQTFVCVRCSGLVREVGHRVKSISASKFSGPEVVALEYGGNEVARAIWLNGYNHNLPEPETDGDVRLFMRQKYYEQKWLDRKRGMAHAEHVKRIITDMFKEDGTRKKPLSKPTLDIQSKPSMIHSDSWVDDNVPIGLISTVKNNNNRMNDVLLNKDMMLSPKSPTFPQTNKTNDIFSELASLDSTVTTTTPSTIVNTSPTSIGYMGHILQPNTPVNASPVNASPINASPMRISPVHTISSLDPYEALRDLSPTVTSPSTGKMTQSLFHDLDPLFKK